MNKNQTMLAGIAIVAMLIFGALILPTEILFLRLLLGVGLGYALTRSFLGFAGSVNRAYNGGSTKLMVVLMMMFIVTAVINAGFLYNSDLSTYDLWINPINWGLIIGGLMFGFGMTFSSCCASGVMTDLVTDLPRAGVTLIFFAMGVYVGFPLQSQLPLISQTVVSSGSYAGQGVFMPDLFGSGLSAYIGAILLTIVFASIIVYLAKRYENKRRNAGTFYGVDSEIEQDRVAQSDENVVVKPFALFSTASYQKLFVTPWSMKMGASIIVIIFTLMLATTQSGWGASTPFGIWFGKAIMLLGASAESVANFADRPVAMFTTPFLDHPITIQNLGIIFGTLICVLLAGQFSFKSSYSAKQLMLFAMGGLFMGLGTRFANGCNVGALYTPIANLSLSGWIFLVFLITGGVLGNKVAKRT